MFVKDHAALTVSHEKKGFTLIIVIIIHLIIKSKNGNIFQGGTKTFLQEQHMSL